MNNRFYPNIIPSLHSHVTDKEMKSVNGMVVHAMSEFIHRDALKYTNGYNKVNKTFKNKPLLEYDEWLDAEYYLHLVGLSANFLIYPDGSLKILKKSNVITYHAGVSKYLNWTNLNDDFCGVEILIDGKNHYGAFINRIKNEDWVSENQYKTLNYILMMCEKENPITFKHVIGHSVCSGDHVRGKGKGKRDPSEGFNWKRVNWTNP